MSTWTLLRYTLLRARKYYCLMLAFTINKQMFALFRMISAANNSLRKMKDEKKKEEKMAKRKEHGVKLEKEYGPYIANNERHPSFVTPAVWIWV